MKNQDYISQEYRKACQYCEHGKLSWDGTAVLCPKRGVVALEDLCKRYVYDPLKRKPFTVAKSSPVFSPEDFQL